MKLETFRIPLVLTMWVALAPTASAGQPAALVPVKADMLDGTRLVLRDAGCSLDTPATTWKWTTYEGAGSNYLCKSPPGELYLVAVGQLHGEFTDHQPESLIANAKKTLAARGGKIENEKFEWIDLAGVKKCARVTFTEIEKSGEKVLAVIYVANTIKQVSVKLQYTGATTTEPATFRKMVYSLKMLPEASAPPAPAPPPKAGETQQK